MFAMKSKPPKKIDVRVDCGKYFLRTLTRDDASDRWAAWMSDPKNLRLLNAAPKTMTRDDITAYIEKFDQISHLLIGIFEKQTGLHFGFFRLDIDHRLNRGLMFFMIGEQKYRHWSVTHELRVPLQDYLFDELNLNTVLGSALTSNQGDGSLLAQIRLESGQDHDMASPIGSRCGNAKFELRQSISGSMAGMEKEEPGKKLVGHRHQAKR